jgi:biotin transport system substrate-specific component
MYILLGALGLPVFAGGSSGIGILAGKTGGFLLSFPFCAYLISWMHKRLDTYGYWVGITIGMCIIYVAGVLQLSFILNTPSRVILWGMLPLMLMDLLKAIAAYTVAYPITRILKQLIPDKPAKEG